MAVCVDEGPAGAGDGPLALRLIVWRLVTWRKSEVQAEETRGRLLKDARKRGKTPDRRSLEAAGYVLLLTSLPKADFLPDDVLALYRLRWQIELAFKRMKSLAGLDALPAKKPKLACAWIYAKLIAVLLAERIAGQVRDSPPSAPCGRARRKAARQPVAMAPRQARPRLDPRRRSGTLPVEDAPPRR